MFKILTKFKLLAVTKNGKSISFIFSRSLDVVSAFFNRLSLFLADLSTDSAMDFFTLRGNVSSNKAKLTSSSYKYQRNFDAAFLLIVVFMESKANIFFKKIK